MDSDGDRVGKQIRTQRLWRTLEGSFMLRGETVGKLLREKK